MKYLLKFFILFTFLNSGYTQTIKVPFTEGHWKFPGAAKYQFETFEGEQTLVLNGRAEALNHEFADGVIEVDVYANQKRSFAGISFRQEGNTMDEVYLRMHKSRQVDAVQYTPIFNGESNWQLYRELQAQVGFKTEGWNHLKIKIEAYKATVDINGKEVLIIDKLRSNNVKGSIGLFGLFGNRFANFSYTPSTPAPLQLEETAVADNIVGEWQLSTPAIFEAQALSTLSAGFETAYQSVKTEPSGLLPISQHVRKPSKGAFEQNKEDYIIAKLVIHADQKMVKPFSFDYSDRMLLFLNEEIVFSGDNAFRAKGLQHTGHLGIDSNTVYLNLKKGKNELHCVIIERANGWGLMAKFKDKNGIRIMN